jgi:hypothetical protein
VTAGVSYFFLLGACFGVCFLRDTGAGDGVTGAVAVTNFPVFKLTVTESRMAAPPAVAVLKTNDSVLESV